MKKEKWIWMPHVGHLIVGEKCRFRLNTCVGKYIVSTVGEYIPDSAVLDIIAPEFKNLKGDKKEFAFIRKYKAETIGLNRLYETMVFKAQKSKEKCCPFENCSDTIDFEGYNTPEDAYVGHLKLCKKWSKKG